MAIENFDANRDINKGQMSELIMDGETYANFKSFKCDVDSDSEEVFVAGKWGKETVYNGIKGSGSFSLYEVFDGLDEKILESFKEKGYWEFNARVRQWNRNTGAERWAIYEHVKVKKFSPTDVELGKIAEKTYEFTVNPDNIHYE